MGLRSRVARCCQRSARRPTELQRSSTELGKWDESKGKSKRVPGKRLALIAKCELLAGIRLENERQQTTMAVLAPTGGWVTAASLSLASTSVPITLGSDNARVGGSFQRDVRQEALILVWLSPAAKPLPSYVCRDERLAKWGKRWLALRRHVAVVIS